jgi:3-dehydroquinate synthase
MIIRHRLGSYPIRFSAMQTILAGLPSGAYILTDENVQRHFAIEVTRGIVLPPGELNKSLGTFQFVLSKMAQARCNRQTSLVAVGGGVIGDLGGFLAASYMRGIPYIQVPTTLLSQVDSSVGGKVGVDLPEGKNLVGAFYPPTEVAIPEDAISTLSARQFANGMAEVLKYGFILDESLSDELHARTVDLPKIVRRCIELKAEVVEADEFERLGIRAKLNFGHTVGHALEQVLKYDHLLHGEAIAIGMVAETLLGEKLGITEPGTTEIVRDRLRQYGLPTEWEGLRKPDLFLDAITRDKKATDGQLAFSLLVKIGECKLVERVPASEVRAVLSEL